MSDVETKILTCKDAGDKFKNLIKLTISDNVLDAKIGLSTEELDKVLNMSGELEDSQRKLLKKAYKKLAFIYHPDKCSIPLCNPQHFQELHEAHELLEDKERCKNIDADTPFNNTIIPMSKNECREYMRDLGVLDGKWTIEKVKIAHENLLKTIQDNIPKTDDAHNQYSRFIRSEVCTNLIKAQAAKYDYFFNEIDGHHGFSRDFIINVVNSAILKDFPIDPSILLQEDPEPSKFRAQSQCKSYMKDLGTLDGKWTMEKVKTGYENLLKAHKSDPAQTKIVEDNYAHFMNSTACSSLINSQAAKYDSLANELHGHHSLPYDFIELHVNGEILKHFSLD